MKNYYKELAQTGKIKPDPEQEKLVAALYDLQNSITNLAGTKRGFFKKLTSKVAAPKGLYIYGKVGRGKSMLMDGFYKSLKLTQKKRVHFHEFMQGVHASLHQQRANKKANIVEAVARDFAKGLKVLCFDEYEVTDVTDAMILSKLFSAMSALGVVFVITSNKRPEDHYKDGLQRQSYLDFCTELAKVVDVVSLDAKQDYRLTTVASSKNYFTPLGFEATEDLKNKFKSITKDAPIKIKKLNAGGRELKIKFAENAAIASFADLCAAALGAADYLAIAKKFEYLFLENIPVMAEESRNEAKRFITLIDVLYENKIKLVVSSAAEPNELYKGHSGGFEFNRTASRLIEMRGWSS